MNNINRGPLGRKERGEGEDPVNVAKELKRIGEEVKDYAEKAQKEVKRAGDLSTELKGKVDEVLTKQSELQNRLQDIEQKQARTTGDEPEVRETVGSAFAKAIEASTDFKATLLRPKHGKSINVEISRKAIINSVGSGASLTYPADVLPLVAPLVRRLTIRDLMMPGRTSQSAIFYPRESGFTNNADIQSEGEIKGKSELTFEDITQPVVTIAHTLDVSLQMLADVPYLASYIDGRLVYLLKFKEEDQLLKGSGIGNNLEGIYTAASDYLQPSGAVVSNEQQIDRLRLMILQAELADAMVTGIVLHPTDWANIELLKDTDNRYLFTNPQNTTTGRLWGRDVVATKAMTQGTRLVGDFAAHSQILDREDANVAISFENKDNFERNLATMRVEERLATAIYRGEAFVKDESDLPT